MTERMPTVVIVGGGFAGLSAAKALRKAPVQVLLIDRTNHHLFQPLLYQVATSGLAPGQVASPIREILRNLTRTIFPRRQRKRLEKLGVEVRLGHAADQIDEEGVIVAGGRITSRTVIWTAGVAPSAAGKWLNVETDRAGRVRIQPDLMVPGHPEIFVVGDTATLNQDGKPLGGVAQVAMQQGRYAGRLTKRRVSGKSEPRPFRYFDKGTMAVVGQGYAVLQSGKLRLKGSLAWMAWAAVHIMFLAQPGLRVSVFLQWMWTYLTRQRGCRLIVNHHGWAPESQTSGAQLGPVISSKRVV